MRSVYDRAMGISGPLCTGVARRACVSRRALEYGAARYVWGSGRLVAGHEATLLAARLVRTLSAAHFVRGVERPRDLGSPVRVVLPLRAVFNLES